MDDTALSPCQLYKLMEKERQTTTETCGQEDFAPFFIAHLIREKLEYFERMEYLLDDDAKVVIDKILQFAQKLSSTIGLSRSNFCKHFSEQIKTPPLELIWLLDVKYDLMDITSYIMEKTLRGDSSNFRQQFLSFCSCSYLRDSTTRRNCLEIFEKLLESIIITSVCKNTNDAILVDLKSFSNSLLKEITLSFINQNDTCVSKDVQKFLLYEIQSISLPAFIKKQYFSEQLLFILSESSNLTPNQVIQQQETFNEESTEGSKMEMINLLIRDPQPPLETMKLLMGLIVQRNGIRVNWPNILLTIKLWEKMYTSQFEAVKYLKDQIKALMFDSIAQSNSDNFISSLILIRHCSLVSPVTFFRYETWYKHMFEHEQYSPIRDASSFTFFTNFLTDLIEIEPPSFLQVQATYWPYIPTGCRSMWNDYIVLAKCRIQDYNDIECIMEFESLPKPQQDVEDAIKAFQKTDNIPVNIFQLSMLDKRGYMNFLNALLQKPVGVRRSDARLRFIEQLNKKGMIPTGHYAKYKSNKT